MEPSPAGSSQQANVKQKTYTLSLFVLGVSSPILLLPMLYHATTSVKCAYCVSTMCIVLLTEALPAEATALLPLFIFRDVEIAHFNFSAYQGGLLSELSRMMIIYSLCWTSALQRVSLWMLDLLGTRVLSLMLGCIGTAVLTALLMQETVALLITMSLVRRIVLDVMDDHVQLFHKRALCMKMRGPEDQKKAFSSRQALLSASTSDSLLSSGTTLSVITKRLFAPDRKRPTDISMLADIGQHSLKQHRSLRVTPPPKSTPDSDSSSESMKLPLANVETRRSTSKTTTWCSSPTDGSPAQQSDQRRSPSKGSPKSITFKPSLIFPLPDRIKKPVKKASILEDGFVVQPGTSSPTKERKALSSADSYQTSSPRRTSPKETNSLKLQKQAALHNQLNICVAASCIIASMMNLPGNHANQKFIQYFRGRFSEETMTNMAWWLLMAPVQICAFLALWLHLRSSLIIYYDAPLDKEGAEIVTSILEQKLLDLGEFSRTEGYPTVIIGNWLIYHCLSLRSTYPSDQQSIKTKNSIDFLTVMLIYTVPWVKCLWGEAVHFRDVIRGLPWGALIMCAGTGVVGLMVQDSGLDAWLTETLARMTATSVLGAQVAITVCSSVVTEIMSNGATVSLLLPVVVDAAIDASCNPLYFAIPVTVAASTSFVLPTASVSMSLLSSAIDTGPLDMLLSGLAFKAIVVTAILLSVNIMAEYRSMPHWLPTKASGVSNASLA